MNQRPRRLRRPALAVAGMAMLIAGLTPSVASAAPPTGRFLNPDPPDLEGQGPGNVVSDKPDGTNDRYHFTLRIADPDNPCDITSVEIQIEDGDADTAFETIGTASSLGSATSLACRDVWEFVWDQSDHTPATDVDNDPGAVRAVVLDGSGTTFIPGPAGDPVTFMNGTAETAEITFPAHRGELGFYDHDRDARPDALIRGTVSAGITSADEIELYYATQHVDPDGLGPLPPADDPSADPDWVDCEVNVVLTGNAWSALCELATTVPPTTASQVRAIAVRTDPGNAGAENGTGSGDAHRVRPYDQVGDSVEILADADIQTVGLCNTYTAEALDDRGSVIVGASLDVHALGPASDIQFADNRDDPDEEDRISDPFSAPDTGVHTSQPAAGCDTSEAIADAPEDNDSDSTGTQGLDAAPPGTKHIETPVLAPGVPQGTGVDGFVFALDSETAGPTAIDAWFDSTENDTVDVGEPRAATTTAWQNPGGSTQVDGDPNEDTNVTGTPHTVTGTARDGAGNPRQVTLRFRVYQGPHADDDLDGIAGTPAGYFGDCTTDASGSCSEQYTGVDTGLDRIRVWANESPEPPGGAFEADANDPMDEAIQATWTGVCIDTDPDTVTDQVGGSQQITAFVTDGAFSAAGDSADAPGEIDNDCSGNPVPGRDVAFSVVDDDPDASLSPDADGNDDAETATTDASGKASVTIQNTSKEAGDNTVTADVQETGGETGDTDAKAIWRVDCPGFRDDPRNQVVGSSGNDTLKGSPGPDVICGLEGDDVLRGVGGRDVIVGGPGNDKLKGGAGKDKLKGGPGKDRLNGGPGQDRCVGGPGRDRERNCEG